MPIPAVHLSRFQTHAGLIQWRETDFSDCHVDVATLRILDVASQLEADTAITVTHSKSLGLLRDTNLAAFLPQWDLEEAEHCLALRHALSFHDYESPIRPAASISLRRRLVSRIPLQPLSLSPQTPFLFCVLGAAAEYVATVMYGHLANNTTGALSRLLRDITRQEARHFAFFLAEARQRGESMSVMNGRIATRILRLMWTPIGVPTLGLDMWQMVFADWLTDPEIQRQLVKMDRIVDTIPHLSQLRLMTRFLELEGSPCVPPT